MRERGLGGKSRASERMIPGIREEQIQETKDLPRTIVKWAIETQPNEAQSWVRPARLRILFFLLEERIIFLSNNTLNQKIYQKLHL